MNLAHYSHLADLFDFPRPGFASRGEDLLFPLKKDYPESAEELEGFLKGIPEKVEDLQELYTRSFDVQSITTLDIGYVLFGDDYKRAELLSHLTREHVQVENDCRGELADHLPNVLRLLPKLNQPALLDELVREILLPALLLMIREFDSERIIKKNESYQKHYKTLIQTAPGADPTIYCRALQSLLKILKKDFELSERMAQLTDWSRQPRSNDFLGLVEKEIEIEENANPANSGCDS